MTILEREKENEERRREDKEEGKELIVLQLSTLL